MNKELKKICKGCKKEFTTEYHWQVFCNKECRSNFFVKKNREIIKKENYPIYIDKQGKKHQLDFDPVIEKQKFENFRKLVDN